MTIKLKGIIVAGFLVAGASLPSPCAEDLKVWAQIDGRSRLVVKTNGIYWDHISWNPPGRFGTTNLPTLINGFSWYPSWDTVPGESSILGAATVFTDLPVAVDKGLGRGPVTVLQQPTQANDHTLVVEFDDDAPLGPDNYEVTLPGVNTIVWTPVEIQVSQVAISWASESNRLYQVQYSTNANATNWFDLGEEIIGSGQTHVVFDSVLGQSRRFYRIVPLP